MAFTDAPRSRRACPRVERPYVDPGVLGLGGGGEKQEVRAVREELRMPMRFLLERRIELRHWDGFATGGRDAEELSDARGQRQSRRRGSTRRQDPVRLRFPRSFAAAPPVEIDFSSACRLRRRRSTVHPATRTATSRPSVPLRTDGVRFHGTDPELLVDVRGGQSRPACFPSGDRAS